MSNKKIITELTKEQTDLFPVYVDKWTKIGMNNEPCNIPEAVAAVKQCYEDAGLKCPDSYFVFESPMQAALGVAMMQEETAWNRIQTACDDMYEMWLLLGRPPEYGVPRPTTFSKELKEFKKKMKDPKKPTAEETQWLEARLAKMEAEHEEYMKELSDKSRGDFWQRVELAIGAQNPGSHDAGWLAFYDYMRNVLKLEEETKLAGGHIRLAQFCGWWSAYENCFILQDRHKECHLDDQGRLNNESGMALYYGDGFGVYALEGHRVDEQLVLRPEEQTPDTIEKETNADIRAIRLNRYPWPRYIKDMKGECIDQRENEVDGTEEALYRMPDGSKRLVYTCVTGRLMTSAVPNDIEKCVAAQVYLAGPEKLNIIAAT